MQFTYVQVVSVDTKKRSECIAPYITFINHTKPCFNKAQTQCVIFVFKTLLITPQGISSCSFWALLLSQNWRSGYVLNLLGQFQYQQIKQITSSFPPRFPPTLLRSISLINLFTWWVYAQHLTIHTCICVKRLSINCTHSINAWRPEGNDLWLTTVHQMWTVPWDCVPQKMWKLDRKFLMFCRDKKFL